MNTPERRQPARYWIRRPDRRALGKGGGVAFTLIELLVVISIIGVLAGLVVGLTGLATRKSKESRLRTDMTKLATEIENYKSALGFYPPDHQVGGTQSIPSPNQLYYELTGTIYTNNQFYARGGQDGLLATSLSGWFGSSGFANAARGERDLKFTAEFKGGQVKRIAIPPVEVLAAPVKGRPLGSAGSYTLKTATGEEVNPWLYVSTNPTNNADRFDLWVEVVVGGKLMRISNWEKDPVVLSP